MHPLSNNKALSLPDGLPPGIYSPAEGSSLPLQHQLLAGSLTVSLHKPRHVPVLPQHSTLVPPVSLTRVLLTHAQM